MSGQIFPGLDQWITFSGFMPLVGRQEKQLPVKTNSSDIEKLQKGNQGGSS